MDYYNTLWWSMRSDPYTSWQSIYHPVVHTWVLLAEFLAEGATGGSRISRLMSDAQAVVTAAPIGPTHHVVTRGVRDSEWPTRGHVLMLLFGAYSLWTCSRSPLCSAPLAHRRSYWEMVTLQVVTTAGLASLGSVIMAVERGNVIIWSSALLTGSLVTWKKQTPDSFLLTACLLALAVLFKWYLIVPVAVLIIISKRFILGVTAGLFALFISLGTFYFSGLDASINQIYQNLLVNFSQPTRSAVDYVFPSGAASAVLALTSVGLPLEISQGIVLALVVSGVLAMAASTVWAIAADQRDRAATLAALSYITLTVVWSGAGPYGLSLAVPWLLLLGPRDARIMMLILALSSTAIWTVLPECRGVPLTFATSGFASGLPQVVRPCALWRTAFPGCLLMAGWLLFTWTQVANRTSAGTSTEAFHVGLGT